MSGYLKPVKITVSDPETGAVMEERVLSDDYALIVSGNRYLKNIQIMGHTHMLAVARDSGRQPQAEDAKRLSCEAMPERPNEDSASPTLPPAILVEMERCK